MSHFDSWIVQFFLSLRRPAPHPIIHILQCDDLFGYSDQVMTVLFAVIAVLLADIGTVGYLFRIGFGLAAETPGTVVAGTDQTGKIQE